MSGTWENFLVLQQHDFLTSDLAFPLAILLRSSHRLWISYMQEVSDTCMAIQKTALAQRWEIDFFTLGMLVLQNDIHAHMLIVRSSLKTGRWKTYSNLLSYLAQIQDVEHTDVICLSIFQCTTTPNTAPTENSFSYFYTLNGSRWSTVELRKSTLVYSIM